MRSLTILVTLPFASCSPDAKKPVTPAGGGGGTSMVQVDQLVPLESLTAGAHVHGFTATNVFLDDAGKPMGARFVHLQTKFTFDYLRVETAPQGFLWVNSFPTSDKGEPHTQEHLLLGKGDRGRKLGSSEVMALAESSAFTEQWFTAYHFHTVAGHDVFWPVFQNHLDALINPDYTDEEIRREVRNFGVDKSPEGGTLRLEEKGTVYNEMVRTYENPGVGMWRTAKQLMYGSTHPLALDSGGEPSAIRTMTAEDIRTFHRGAYHLANMGMVAAFPASMKLEVVLDQTSAILAKAATRTGKVTTEADLPKPAGAAPGTVKLVEYPFSDATNPGQLMLAWPPTRTLDETEHALVGLFLDAFAGDESTTLYKQLIDGKSRVLDLGASAVWSWSTHDQGQPVFVGLSGVKADKVDDKTVTEVRALVLAELARIAKLPDGDPELAAISDRVKSRVIDLQRRLNKFLDSPPGFGFRGIGSSWKDHLHALTKSPGFAKSVTMRPALTAIQQLLAAGGNPWRDRLRTWGLLATPYAVATKPSPTLRAKLDSERTQRIEAELGRLQKQYATKDAAATLARYQTDYDAETRKLEASAKATELPPLVDSLPMTLDDGLQYKLVEIASAKAFVATFDSMASSRISLAFRLDGIVPPDDGMYLAALPSLLADVGVIIDGKPLPADQMRERIRKEILELSVYMTESDRTGRLELVFAGAGNSAAETRTAIGWMRRVLFAPDWRIDNLPRLRDLIDQQLTGSRARMLGAEEHWVFDPRDAWRHQNAEQAHATAFLTQMHDLHRLRWMLLDPRDPKVTDETVTFLALLGEATKLPRAHLLELSQALATATKPKTAALAKWFDAGAKLSAGGQALAKAAGKDLAQLLSDLPDNSLAADWKYLTRQMAADLKFGAAKALARLEALRQQIVMRRNVRIVEVGSPASQTAIASDVEKLVGELVIPQIDDAYGRSLARPFVDRLREREPGAKPVFVGLVAPGTSSGVFLNTVPATWYGNTSDDAVLDYLTANLYTGHGGHSIFMKTWAAGLAYSNGLRPSIDNADLLYYAERTPLLPTTLKFVIDQLRKAKPDPSIARYAVATSFSSRVATGYEARASAMAANLADYQTPELVRAFRTRVLEFAKQPDLATKLFARMEAVYGKVLPGYGKLDPNGTYFVIGPDKQLAAYEDYLHATLGKATKLYRLYPRDFWIPAKL
ncbi:MAG: hypothetical protein ABI867_24605 [Kofleriaceae bacterium]